VVAARTFGFEADVALLPETDRADLLATVTLAPADWPTDEEGLLFDAIETRQTVREPFEPEPVDESVVAALAAAAVSRSATFIAVQASTVRTMLAALVAEGDRRLFADPAWRRELASWIRGSWPVGDGMRLGSAPASLTRMTVRAIDLGDRVARVDAPLVEQAPLLGIIATVGDGIRDWLVAGRALERVLLTAARHDLQAGFLNQACQIADLREQVRALILDVGQPQVVVRVGRPRRVAKATPRRDLFAVLDRESPMVSPER
jgi:hypothetical protein